MRRKSARSLRIPFPAPRRVLRHGFRPVVLRLEDRTLLSLNATFTSVIASSAAVAYGQPVTFTAHVATLAPGATTPTGGTVTFIDNGTSLGVVPLVNGVASLTTSDLGLGPQSITAAYGGDGANFAASASGTIDTVAGNGQYGHTGDGGPATNAELFNPYGVAVDAAGNLFIADYYNDVVREVVKATGDIITVAGSGTRVIRAMAARPPAPSSAIPKASRWTRPATSSSPNITMMRCVKW